MLRKNGLARSKKSGYTLVEVMTAASLGVMALAGGISVLIGGSTSWIRGQAKIEAETSAELGIKLVEQELRPAMAVTVDSNGLGITYQLPSVDSTGRYVAPPTWDGITRRIALSGSNLVKTTNGKTLTLVSGVILTDPQSSGGTGTYKVFQPGPGATTRSITIELVTQRNGVKSATVNARNRETIYIRNVPVYTR